MLQVKKAEVEGLEEEERVEEEGRVEGVMDLEEDEQCGAEEVRQLPRGLPSSHEKSSLWHCSSGS